MASLCRRSVLQLCRRSFSTTALRNKEDTFPDPMDLATGLEKKELLAYQAGNDDPFYMKARKRGVGTKEEPNLVPSFEDSRIIGCVCEEDSASVVWMWIHEGTPRRCNCGHWFKLERKPYL
ncbi:hypothetical protein PV325_009263 [Microctonus aethiopoides]|uniref:Cytochrome c oxidase subunit 5B, mitochondrial n=1 Tax=Microctonus aethiopoides TaxID=144406 RepID=A0AA39FXQ7_9HYME|nr:hypothetical protein PV325_009263 [Microctonus aethiopoides]KAK0092088.1 hypothetical protein PV326_002210 [Microctonus aethiopoides]KAK0177481.1 hypothetical protein PV328_001531 [Microctonus aethiopoides]